MIVWSVDLLMASAAASRLSDSPSDRQIVLMSMIPAVGYTLAALALWLVVHRRAIRDRRVHLRSLMVLIGVLSPGLFLLRLVWWEYWWPS